LCAAGTIRSYPLHVFLEECKPLGTAGFHDGNCRESKLMTRYFKVGDHVQWNSEAGQVCGTIKKVITSRISFKGYTVHASKDEPQYLIKSGKTDHLAMHKGSALRKNGKHA
jgi:hypothetical protein